MEENLKINEELNHAPEERTYTQDELDAIVNQYKIQLNQMRRQAQEEISKRDLGNFYQTLSILFEIVRNRDAYTPEFSKMVVETVEKSVRNLFEDDKDKENEQ